MNKSTFNYTNMSAEELTAELLRLTDLFDEIIDEKDALLSQTGHHVPGTLLLKKYNAELENVNKKIDGVKECLKSVQEA